VPLLDTTRLSRLASGKKTESYWPVAVAKDGSGHSKFHCIILKGGEKYPSFPRPLLSDFDFEIPLSDSLAEDDDAAEGAAQSEVERLEEQLVRNDIQLGLFDDYAEFTRLTASERLESRTIQTTRDNALLKLFAYECKLGDDRSMKAFDMLKLFKDEAESMLGKTAKAARYYGRTLLAERIDEVIESRLMGTEDAA